ncbi:MAG: hypothetical protein Q7O66_00810 [Dehalococcoidia bacterium]|nr:hypothetical protein [Dehalococcoidia bacterium]
MNSYGWTQRRYGPTRDLPASGYYEQGAFVVRNGYKLRDKLKAAGFTWCSPDRTWRRAMSQSEYDAFDLASIGMRDTTEDRR